MLKREERVIKAFINCVKAGEYTFAYACILIEDNSKYGWLSDEAKEVFYAEFETKEDATPSIEEKIPSTEVNISSTETTEPTVESEE